MKNNDNLQNTYQAENLSSTDEFWLNILRQRANNSIQFLEDTAKQYITITSFSQTVYFAAISFSEVKKSLFLLPANTRFGIIILLIIPLICWIYSLICATRAFAYKLFNTHLQSPRAAKEFYYEVLNHKSKLLQKGFLSLVVGFIFLIVNVVVYLQFYPVVKESNTKV